jgi:hypothetical protein
MLTHFLKSEKEFLKPSAPNIFYSLNKYSRLITNLDMIYEDVKKFWSSLNFVKRIKEEIDKFIQGYF